MTRALNVPGPILMPWNGVWPTIHETAFIAPGAVIIGDVVIGPDSNIWFGVVIRGSCWRNGAFFFFAFESKT